MVSGRVERGQPEDGTELDRPEGRGRATEAVREEERDGDEQHREPLGEHVRVEDPEVRIEGRDHGRAQAHPATTQLASEQPDRHDRPRADHARHQAVGRLTRAAEQGRDREQQGEERRVRRGRDDVAGEHPDVGIREAVPVGEEVRLQVVVPRIGQTGERPDGEGVAGPHDERAAAIAASHHAKRRSARPGAPSSPDTSVAVAIRRVSRWRGSRRGRAGASRRGHRTRPHVRRVDDHELTRVAGVVVEIGEQVPGVVIG